MPEEKKKESFTFSDKIKNSKQATSKSFANRVSSKIGSDGKPRQTVFARAKRDVPFFAAAAAALLLLPFMYKYSGQVEETPSTITPGYEDSIVNPDRSGFDFTGDPDGQISQLSGRDSMDLIVGLGRKSAADEDDDSLADIYRSGLDDSSSASYARSDMEEEQNTTNIYKYRKQAAPQTRAAFRRAATKLGSLKPSGINNARGGRLGVGNWGGSMKKAANKVRPTGQVNSPKPVSLQPLASAGKPARSYFGQGAAQEAKRSRDAMGKADARQALLDSQMRNVEPGRIGGFEAGPGGIGGGNGKLDRNFTFNGKEPWWWDMMKRRSQMEWERKFNYRWGWIDFGTKLAMHWLEGLLNCLIMGDSDGDVDHFIGTSSSSGKQECCGKSASKIAAVIKQQTGLDFGKEGCQNYQTLVGKDACPDGWVDKTATPGLNGWQQRWACFGGRVKGAADLELAEKNNCANMKIRDYEVIPQGKARNWHTYIFVTAYNYVPVTLKNGRTVPLYLCTRNDSDGLHMYRRDVAGAGVTEGEKQYDGKDGSDLGASEQAEVSRERTAKGQKQATRTAKTGKDSEMYEVNSKSRRQKAGTDYATFERPGTDDQMNSREDKANSCVIFVAESQAFDQNEFERRTIDNVLIPLVEKQLADKINDTDTVEKLAQDAFDQLDLRTIESFSAKRALGFRYKTKGLEFLPMNYSRFRNAYITHRGTAVTDKARLGRRIISERKLRKGEGEDYVLGQTCHFQNVSISCVNGERGGIPQAKVVFKTGFKGQKSVKAVEGVKDVVVKATYTPTVTKDGYRPDTYQTVLPDEKIEGNVATYSFTRPLREEGGRGKFEKGDAGTNVYEDGNVTWQLYRGGEVVGMASCPYNQQGNDVTPGFQTESGDTGNVEKGNEDTNPCPECEPFNVETNGGKCVWQIPCVNNEHDPSKKTLVKGDPDYCNGVEPKKEEIKKQEPPKQCPPPTATPISFATDIKDIPTQKWPEREDIVGNAQPKENFQQCTLPGINRKVTYDQATVHAYLDEVRARANAKADGKVTLKGVNRVSVSNLVDALSIDAAMDPNAKVPLNVVCALGKTIGLNAKDPHVPSSPNQFGAFAAYIDENSSFFPSTLTKTAKGTDRDSRFYGCANKKDVPNRYKEFHWGHYNWNHDTLGDLDGAKGRKAMPVCKMVNGKWTKVNKNKTTFGVGSEGRTPYVEVLKGNGQTKYDQGKVWAPNGKFPLHAIAEATSFQLTDSISGKSCAELKQYNGSIDDYNRKAYVAAYSKIYNATDSCELEGEMNVADALEYINLVCANGAQAKPSNGSALDCGDDYKDSSFEGSAYEAKETEDEPEEGAEQ